MKIALWSSSGSQTLTVLESPKGLRYLDNLHKFSSDADVGLGVTLWEPLDTTIPWNHTKGTLCL